jgi:hypothetical protein
VRFFVAVNDSVNRKWSPAIAGFETETVARTLSEFAPAVGVGRRT